MGLPAARFRSLEASTKALLGITKQFLSRLRPFQDPATLCSATRQWDGSRYAGTTKTREIPARADCDAGSGKEISANTPSRQSSKQRHPGPYEERLLPVIFQHDCDVDDSHCVSDTTVAEQTITIQKSHHHRGYRRSYHQVEYKVGYQEDRTAHCRA